MYGTDFINSVADKRTQFTLCSAYQFKKFENDFNKPVYFLQKPIDIDIFKDMITHIYQTLAAYEKDLILGLEKLDFYFYCHCKWLVRTRFR